MSKLPFQALAAPEHHSQKAGPAPHLGRVDHPELVHVAGRAISGHCEPSTPAPDLTYGLGNVSLLDSNWM